MASEKLTAAVAEFVADTDAATIPPAAREAARRAILDTVGVALAGSREVCTGIVRDVVGGIGPTGPATLLGRPARVSALDAALINGTAAHALDYDDTHASFRGHPSAPIVAAALAAAELACASGTELVDSYVIGMEVAGRIGRSLGPSHAARGFHSTATLGVLGATVAASRLLGLDARQTAMALGAAASSASGLRINFGTMTKPLHVGNASRSGLLSALLARRGFTATTGGLDPATGFTKVFSPGDGDPAAIGEPGDSWQVLDPGIAVKKYPCCNRGHRAADAILRLVREHDVAPADVTALRVRMPPGQVDDDGRVGPMIYPRPEDGLQAKFSMQYVVAAAVADGALRMATFTDAAVRRPEIAELLPRVQVVAEAVSAGPPADADYVEVTARLRDGRECTAQVRHARGDPRGGEQLTMAELAAKYRDCASVALPDEQVGVSLEALGQVDQLDRVSELTATLVLAG